MMVSNLTAVFSIDVFHSYFENGQCNCLQFKPTVATEKIFNRFNCFMQKTIYGFEYYINSSAEIDGYLDYIKLVTGQDFFEFDMVNNNPSFTLFTELPIDWLGSLVYDTEKRIATETGIELQLNLSENTGSDRFGKLKVHFNDLKAKPKFKISFSARATQWQYYVINRSLVPLNNPSIVGKTEINFNRPEVATIASGEQALLFSSGNNLIPLSEVPKYKFDLVNQLVPKENLTTKSQSGNKILYKGLPNPVPKRFGKVNIDQQDQISSPMYIFI